MAPNYQPYGKFVETTLKVIEHEDTRASILEDLKENTEADIKELIKNKNEQKQDSK